MRRTPRVSVSRRVRKDLSLVAPAPAAEATSSGTAAALAQVEPLENRQLLAAQLISVNTAGAAGNGDSFEASASGDGRFVVFTSTSSDLVANDTNGKRDIFLRDRVAGTTTLISRGVNPGELANDDSFEPKINNDGTFI